MKKKILLGLGSLAAVVAPVASVVSCGSEDKTPAVPQLTKPARVGSSTIVAPVNLDAVNIHPATAAVTESMNSLLDASQRSVMGAIESKIEDATNIMKTESNFAGMQKMINAFYEMGAVTFKFNVTFHGVTSTFNVVNHFESYFDIDAINVALKNGSVTQALQVGRNASQLALDEQKAKWEGFIPTQAFIDFKTYVAAQNGSVLMFHNNPGDGGSELPLTATVDQAKTNLDQMMAHALQNVRH